jgi:hypothetical protein
MVTTDDGQTWAVTQLPSGFGAQSVDCPNVGSCVAGGQLGQPSPSGGGAIFHSSDGGSSWTLAMPTAGSGSRTGGYGVVASISCADATDCAAATTFGGKSSASQVLVSSDGGATWSAAPGSGLPRQFTARQLSCPSGGDCWVGGAASTPPPSGVKNYPGQQGFLAMTADGGQTFQLSQLPPGTQYDAVTAVSCPSMTVCYAAALSNMNPEPEGSQPQTPFVLLSYSASPDG